MSWSPRFQQALVEVEDLIRIGNFKEEDDPKIVELISSAQSCDELIHVLVIYHIYGKNEEEAFHKKLRQFRSILTIEQVNQMLNCFDKGCNCYNLIGVIKLRLEEREK